MPIYTNDPYDDGFFPVEPSLRSSIGIGPKVTKAIDAATRDWLNKHPEATTTVEDNSLTNAKFMDGSVNSRVIEDESITTDDIADLAVTTPKIADNAVTAAKIASAAADGLRTMSTTQPGVAKVGAGLAMNDGAIELDGNGDIATAVTTWLNAHPEATTTVQDNSITDSKLIQPNGILERVSDIDGIQIANISNWEKGEIYFTSDSSWQYLYSSVKVRTKQGVTCQVNKGDKIYLTDYSDARFNVSTKDANDAYVGSGWKQAAYTIPVDGECVIEMSNVPETTITDINILTSLLRIKKNGSIDVIKSRLDDAEDNIEELEKMAEDAQDRLTAIDGKYYLKESDWELGQIYMQNGADWQYLYGTTRIRTKRGFSYHLPAGTVISLTDFTGYRMVIGYTNSNGVNYTTGWRTAPFAVPVEADVVISVSRSPEVTETSTAYLFAMVRISSKSDANARTYHGETIDIASDKKYQYTLGVAMLPQPSAINSEYGKSVTSYQAMAAYGDYLVVSYSNDLLVVLNKSDSSIAGVLDAETGHGNAMQFSDRFYDSNDLFPLLYVTTTASPSSCVVNILRIASLTSVTTVGSITLPSIYAGCAIDSASGHLLLVGYKAASFSDPSGNGMTVSEYDVSGESPVLLDTNDIEFIPTMQDCEIRNGMLFVSSYGLNSNVTNKVYVIDLGTLKVRNVLTSFDTYYETVNEPECLTFCGDLMYLSAGPTVRSLDFS